MGSNCSSSSCGPKYHAKLTDSPCKCDQPESRRISVVRRISVPMDYTGIVGGHHCIEIYFTCTRCSQTVRWILELGHKGKYFLRKYYRKYICEKSRFSPSRLTMADVKRIYDSMRGSYDLWFYNCRHFAEELFNKLRQIG